MFVQPGLSSANHYRGVEETALLRGPSTLGSPHFGEPGQKGQAWATLHTMDSSPNPLSLSLHPPEFLDH